MECKKLEALEDRIREALEKRKSELNALDADDAKDKVLCARVKYLQNEAYAKKDFDAFKTASAQKHEAEEREEWREERRAILMWRALISQAEAKKMISEVRDEVGKIDKTNRARVADLLEEIIKIEEENTRIIDRANRSIERMKKEIMRERDNKIPLAFPKNMIRDFIVPITRREQALGRDLVKRFRE